MKRPLIKICLLEFLVTFWQNPVRYRLGRDAGPETGEAVTIDNSGNRRSCPQKYSKEVWTLK